MLTGINLKGTNLTSWETWGRKHGGNTVKTVRICSRDRMNCFESSYQQSRYAAEKQQTGLERLPGAADAKGPEA